MGWSGGKDSTCGAYKHLYRGDLLKAVCYVPMFTEDIPLINKEHYEFILGQKEIFTQMGGQVFFAKGITYYDYCLSIYKSGIYKGQVKGYPYINACGFRRDSKIKAASKCGFPFGFPACAIWLQKRYYGDTKIKEFIK